MQMERRSRENKTIICDGTKMLDHSPIPSQIMGEGAIDQGMREPTQKYLSHCYFLFTTACLFNS